MRGIGYSARPVSGLSGTPSGLDRPQAARYFVRELDVDPDTTSLLGLEDDAAVINFVLDAIGQPELKVQTDG